MNNWGHHHSVVIRFEEILTPTHIRSNLGADALPIFAFFRLILADI